MLALSVTMRVSWGQAWALLAFSLTLGTTAADAQGLSFLASIFREESHLQAKDSGLSLRTAGLTLPLVDRFAYAEEHGGLFGHHARNVRHVATDVSPSFEILTHCYVQRR